MEKSPVWWIKTTKAQVECSPDTVVVAYESSSSELLTRLAAGRSGARGEVSELGTAPRKRRFSRLTELLALSKSCE